MKKQFVWWIIMALLLCGVCTASAQSRLADVPNVTVSPNHSHQWAREVTNEATCISPGSYVEFCNGCGIQQNGTTPARGHNIVYDRSNAPTCTQGGVVVGKCTRCDYVEYIQSGSLGHNMTSVSSKPTCTRSGFEGQRCTRCGYQEGQESKPLGHSYGEWTVQIEPTCTESGLKICYCSRCGMYWDEEMEPTGHNWVAAMPMKRTSKLSPAQEEEMVCAACGEFTLYKLPVTIPTAMELIYDELYTVDMVHAVKTAYYFVSTSAVKLGKDKVKVTALTFADGEYLETMELSEPVVLDGNEPVELPPFKAYVSQEDIDRGCVEFELRAEGVVWDDATGDWSETAVFSNVIEGSIALRYGKAKLILTMTQTNGPTDYQPGETVTYDWEVWNAGDYSCSFDSIALDMGYDMTAQAIHSTPVTAADVSSVKMNAKDKLSGTCSVVLPSGVQYDNSGMAVLKWQAVGLADESDQSVITVSGIVTFVYQHQKKPAELNLTVEQVSGPADYVRGASAAYNWTLTNDGDEDCTFSMLTDELSADGATVQLSDILAVSSDYADATIAAHSSISGSFTVDMPDTAAFADACYMTFKAAALADETDMTSQIFSNEVQLDYHAAEAAVTPELVLTVVQKSGTVNYEPNAEVTYQWTLENKSDKDCSFVSLMALAGPDAEHMPASFLFADGAAYVDPVIPAGGKMTSTGAMPLPVLEGSPSTCVIEFMAEAVFDDVGNVQSNAVQFTYSVFKVKSDIISLVKGIELAADEKSGVTITKMVKEDVEEQPLPTMTKTVVSEPANGERYIEGETVHFSVTFANCTPYTLKDVELYDLLDGLTPYVVRGELDAWDEVTFQYSYQVTAMDVILERVNNMAMFGAVHPELGYITGYSNMVTVPCGEELPTLTVTKTETSTPAKGGVYQLNDVVTYSITIKNETEETMYDVTLLDAENWYDEVVLQTFEKLKPDEACSLEYAALVGDDDLEQGMKTNYAYATFTRGTELKYYAYSDLVQSPCGKAIPPVNPNPPTVKPVPVADHCRRVLSALGSADAVYDLFICPTHVSASQKAHDAMQNGDFAAARAAWTEAVNDLYSQCYKNASSGDARMTVMNDKAMFYAMVAMHETMMRANGSTEQETAEKVCTLLENQCVDLCEALHTAPAARKDSYTGEHDSMTPQSMAACAVDVQMDNADRMRYAEQLCQVHATVLDHGLNAVQQAENKVEAWQKLVSMWTLEMDRLNNMAYRSASADMQQLLAADRAAFGNWVKSHEAFVKLLYGDTAAAAEMMAKTVMNCVLDLCR